MIRSLNTRYVPVEELRRFDPNLRTFTNINKLDELDRINATAAGRVEPAGSEDAQEYQDRPSL
jgi:hypothetical protein